MLNIFPQIGIDNKIISISKRRFGADSQHTDLVIALSFGGFPEFPKTKFAERANVAAIRYLEIMSDYLDRAKREALASTYYISPKC